MFRSIRVPSQRFWDIARTRENERRAVLSFDHFVLAVSTPIAMIECLLESARGDVHNPSHSTTRVDADEIQHKMEPIGDEMACCVSVMF